MNHRPVVFRAALAAALIAFAGRAQPGLEDAEFLAREALGLFQAGDVQGAESLARRALALRPGDPDLLALLGGALAMAGRHGAASAAFAEALEADPANLGIRRNLAASQWQAGRLAAARRSVEAALVRDPGDAGSLLLAGMIAASQGRHAAAARLLEQAGPDALTRPEAMLALLMSYYRLGRLDPARRVSGRLEAAEAEPRIYSMAATAAFKAGDFGPAARLFGTALRSGHAQPGRMRFSEALSRHRAGDSARARAALELLLGEEPGNGDAWNLLGWCFQGEGATGRAIRALERAIQVAPATEKHHLDLGAVLLGQRATWHLAAKRAEEALRRFPDSWRLHQLLGLAQIRQQHFLDAAASYGRASELAPESADARFGWIVALWASGQADQALDAALRGIQQFPSDAALRLQLGRMRLEQHEWGDLQASRLAQARLLEAVALDPELAEAHYELGMLALRQGELAEALARLEAATEAAPSSRSAHYALARCLRQLGRSEEAARAMAVFRELAAEDESVGSRLPVQ